MDLGKSDPENSSGAPQCFNPAFVHAIAVPEVDMLDKVGKICVVARGDGVVDVINLESEFEVAKSQASSKPKKGGQPKQQNPKTKIKIEELGCVWIIAVTRCAVIAIQDYKVFWCSGN